MKVRGLLAAAVIAAFASPAFAAQCPALMTKIDDAMKTAELSDADKAKVTELRKKGEEQHAAGQHADSEATLQEALKILGM